MKTRTLLLLGASLLVLLFHPGVTATAQQGPQGLAGGPSDPGIGILSPIRVVTTPEGTLLVSDHQRQRIFELDPKNLRILGSFGVDGPPLGIACSGKFVLVGNDKSKRVEIYHRDGRLMRNLAGPAVTFGQPNAIAVDTAAGIVAVADSQQKVVRLFRNGLSAMPTRTIPASPDPNVLAAPAAVAIDPVRKEILVSDFGATEVSIKPRIQIFDFEGNLVDSISGKEGMMGYRFYRPQGLLADGNGRIFLADSYLGRVVVLDRTSGSTLTTFGSFGTDPGELALPLDVAIAGANSDLFVTNNRQQRIEVFAEGGAIQ